MSPLSFHHQLNCMKNNHLSAICICLLFWGYRTCAQTTTLYSQTFNGATAPQEWLLNVPDLHGDDTDYDNLWIINNVYYGTPTTPDEPSAIAGSPQSNYLHIYSYELSTHGPGASANACYDAVYPGKHSFVAIQNVPVITTGYDSVTLSFWWISNRLPLEATGNVYYRTSTMGPWTLITTPITNYNDTGSWKKQNIALPAFNNQSVLEFAFQFTMNGIYSEDGPAFGIDDIKITGVHKFKSSVQAVSQTNDINVYPIPTSGDLYLAHAVNMSVKIYNSIGKILYNHVAIKDPEIINTTNFAPGNYIIKIEGTSDNYTKMFIKQ